VWDAAEVESGAYFYTVSYDKRKAGSIVESFSFEQARGIEKLEDCKIEKGSE
jgi:hypothetical protein